VTRLGLGKAALALLLLLFCTAPTPGDIGGCGQNPDILDAPTFFANKKRIDCSRCSECGLFTKTCSDACDDSQSFDQAFPKDCVPVVHDGEVCLHALSYASCDDYASYVDDGAPQTPTECDFCPAGEGP
jgi:hypothetical protein